MELFLLRVLWIRFPLELLDNYYFAGRWQSGQLHLTVNQTPHGYVGSNPTLPKLWALSSFGRASALHAGGEGFESPRVQIIIFESLFCFRICRAPVVQWIEQQPSKLWIQVRSLAGVSSVFTSVYNLSEYGCCHSECLYSDNLYRKAGVPRWALVV